MSTPDDQTPQHPQTPQYPQAPQYPQPAQYPGNPDGSYPAPPPPGYGQPVTPRNGFGVTALVLGILALVLCWTVWGGIVLGVLALIFGILGIKRANRGEATNKGMSISGVVTGSIGLVIGVLLAVLVGSIFAKFGNQLTNLQDCLNQANGERTKIEQCQQQFTDDVRGR
ncbi:hypothetical protein ATK36_1196 [Amycolatopsis sulphurea]|uniref:DUF4190 domain-containing protein n=1 Tax=Amycolatopsis sulphurea TaxID=76022 RepID=A0A2A9G3X3_9PSEU|nr:DUF4190 domain-containing protein [Amycolatopsis sulphurea]PFG57601.1 hypothetical protein ATK36_1196 [Amycolatopsis sulphurea]